MILLKILACEVAGLLAPLVTLVYRGGWFNTPDDPASPRGLGEPAMRALHARFGAWLADWWWLGVRNRAYGLAYALKAPEFRGLRYETISPVDVSYRAGRLRRIRILGRSEWMLSLGLVHVICGYRLRPVLDELLRNWSGGWPRAPWDVPHRPINMDARPIFTVRPGARDD